VVNMLSYITRIKLSFKLIGAFLLISVILVASNIYALKSMKSIESGSSSMYNKNLVLIKDLANMSDSIHQLNSSISSYLLVKDPTARKAERERISTTKNDLSALLMKLQQVELTRQEETKMKLFSGLWNSYYSIMDQILSLADQNDLDYAISVYEKQMLIKANDISRILFR
jgi:methyl-accepting chemotaxis protein